MGGEKFMREGGVKTLGSIMEEENNHGGHLKNVSDTVQIGEAGAGTLALLHLQLRRSASVYLYNPCILIGITGCILSEPVL